MSDISIPDPEPSQGYDDLSQEVLDNVVNRWGWQDAESEPEPEQPDPVQSEEEAGEGESDGEVAPPSAPGGPIFKDESDTPAAPTSITLPDGREIPLALVQEWADRVPSAPSPQSLAPEPTPSQPLIIPPVSEEDLENAGPAVRALLIIANAQAQRQQELERQLTANREAISTRVKTENAQIANAAATAFQRDHNLPEDLMGRIKNKVQVSDMEAYLNSDPDPYKAVEFALTRSYWNDPEARQYEFDRQMKAQNAAVERKRKLAGVGGNSGSGPRGVEPPVEPGPDGWKQAAIEMVARDMGIRE